MVHELNFRKESDLARWKNGTHCSALEGASWMNKSKESQLLTASTTEINGYIWRPCSAVATLSMYSILREAVCSPGPGFILFRGTHIEQIKGIGCGLFFYFLCLTKKEIWKIYFPSIHSLLNIEKRRLFL